MGFCQLDHVKILLLTTYLQQITLCQKKISHSENLVFKKSCSASNKQKHLKHLTRKHKKGTKINHTVKMIVCPKSRSFFSHIFIKVNLPLKRFNQYLNKQNSTACQNFLDYRLWLRIITITLTSFFSFILVFSRAMIV